MIAHPTRLPRWAKTLVVLVAVLLALLCFILVLNQVAAGRASADRERQDLVAIAARDKALGQALAQGKANSQQLLTLTDLVRDQSALIIALRKQLSAAGIKPVDVSPTKASSKPSGAASSSGGTTSHAGTAASRGTSGSTGKPTPKPSPSPSPLPAPAPSPANTGVCVLIICVK